MRANIKAKSQSKSKCNVGQQKHYTWCKIQPIEYIMANNLSFAEGCVVKYITRWKQKDGIKDLRKIIVNVQFMINQLEGRNIVD